MSTSKVKGDLVGQEGRKMSKYIAPWHPSLLSGSAVDEAPAGSMRGAIIGNAFQANQETESHTRLQ